MVRIGIASAVMGEELRRILTEEGGYDILWVVTTGMDAVAKCLRDPPDLTLIDPNVPVLNGVEATRRIMTDAPCPILLVTETVDGNAGKVFEALGHGALDAVSVAIDGDSEQGKTTRRALMKKIRTLIKLKSDAPVVPETPRQPIKRARLSVPPLIVIGASAGGPKTLAILLSRLPAAFDAAIVIAQHVEQEFSEGLIGWLNAQAALPICAARQGASPKAGHVHIAGTNDHLIITAALTFAYTPDPRELAYRPSVDVLFQSVAACWPDAGQAILLTGMGRDGAEGLAALRQAGWHTIAQDQASSVVYGMPKAAKELGAASEILSLEKISLAMLNIGRPTRG